MDLRPRGALYKRAFPFRQDVNQDCNTFFYTNTGVVIPDWGLVNGVEALSPVKYLKVDRSNEWFA